jgi:hypothetical protein
VQWPEAHEINENKLFNIIEKFIPSLINRYFVQLYDEKI